jgi:hypothetical protein
MKRRVYVEPSRRAWNHCVAAGAARALNGKQWINSILAEKQLNLLLLAERVAEEALVTIGA